jgi:hypothetical protein
MAPRGLPAGWPTVHTVVDVVRRACRQHQCAARSRCCCPDFPRTSEWKSVEQRVPLVWTRCHLGGARSWFRCSASIGGRPCGRRVAKLYLRDHVFACRDCCGLAYASQSENPRYRAISRTQKARMRLGGTANLLEPFPKRPRGMHRWTYRRLLARAMAAQERSIALELEFIRRHYPGLLSRENVAEG